MNVYDRFPNESNHRIELGTRLLKADRVDEAITELQQARRDEAARGIQRLICRRAGRRRAGTDRRDAPVVVDEHPSLLEVAGVVGTGGHRDEAGVDNEERHVSDAIRRVFPRCHGPETPRREPETRAA